MFEKIVRWLIFISIVSFVLAAIFQLLTEGQVSEPCCTISELIDAPTRPVSS